MMIYKKPKDAQEVLEYLETQIVDMITKKNEDEETYKKAAILLNGQKAEGCLKINCLPVGRTADTTALRLAMCYANEKKKTELDTQKKQHSSKQKSIEQNSNSIANKKASLATDRAESDKLLAELTAQNKQYTEFRNEDSSLIEQVENEIQAVISGVKPPEEATTAVAGKKSSKIDKIDQKEKKI